MERLSEVDREAIGRGGWRAGEVEWIEDTHADIDGRVDDWVA